MIVLYHFLPLAKKRKKKIVLWFWLKKKINQSGGKYSKIYVNTNIEEMSIS